MAEVLLFHHAQGLTPGCHGFAERLRAKGHVVHLPDLYEQRTFDTVEEGVEHARQVGFASILERGRAFAEGLGEALVYAGFSLGVMPAQMLAQTRPGAKGALLFHGCVPPEQFESPWPAGVPVQIHMMESDKWAEEDLPAARQLVTSIKGAELFLYPGDGHLFADTGSSDYDAPAARLLEERVLRFLEPLG